MAIADGLSWVFLAAALGAAPASSNDAGLRVDERQLAAVLGWELLWQDPPAGFRVPPGRAANVTLHRKGNSLAYCSRDFGVCARYRTDPNRNWQRVASSASDQDDPAAVLAFAGEKPRKPTGDTKPMFVGPDGTGFTGTFEPGIIWTAVIKLDDPEAVARRYRKIHPAEMDRLKQWIRDAEPRGADRVKSITIACFAPSDPMIYYYVDRAPEPVIMAAFWDREVQDWVSAASSQRFQAPERFDQMRRTIEKVACAVLRFN